MTNTTSGVIRIDLAELQRLEEIAFRARMYRAAWNAETDTDAARGRLFEALDMKLPS